MADFIIELHSVYHFSRLLCVSVKYLLKNRDLEMNAECYVLGDIPFYWNMLEKEFSLAQTLIRFSLPRMVDYQMSLI